MTEVLTFIVHVVGIRLEDKCTAVERHLDVGIGHDGTWNVDCGVRCHSLGYAEEEQQLDGDGVKHIGGCG